MPALTCAREPEDEWNHRFLENRRLMNIGLLRGFELYKPIISAVNGFCLAGGTELIEATNIRIAATHATFGLTEVKRAIVPGGGSMARLPRQISFCNAMEVLLVGDSIEAQDAYRMGLVNRVVPAESLMETAEAIAHKIAENGPLAVQKIKETVLKGLGRPLEEAFALEDEAVRAIIRTEDAREGPLAFTEKRKPRYLGR